MPDEQHPLSDGEQSWLEDLLGRGAGDPEVHGYPGQPRLKATIPAGSVIIGQWYTMPLTMPEISGTGSDLSKLGRLV
jgi:hypothetical protein